MNKGYYDKKVLDKGRTAYFYNSLVDYYKFIGDTEQKATGNAKKGFDMLSTRYIESQARGSSGLSWYGTNDVNSVINEKTSFLFNNELNSFMQSLTNKTVNVDVLDIDQKKKIEFTEQEIGIFSFDLASLGLIRAYEYYSPLLKETVDSYFVESYEISDGKLSFYHIEVPYIPKHIVKFSAKYDGFYSQILNRVVDISELIKDVDEDDIIYYFPEKQEIPRHDVERIQRRNDDGSLKFSTTFKKCFINVPKVYNTLPRIDLIISSSYASSVKANTEMIWNTMAVLAVAQKLSNSNVNYRIIASYGVKTSGAGRGQKDKEAYSFVKLKDENQPLDINLMATLISDGRFFRYDMFKGFYATMFDAGYDSLINYSEIGIPLNDSLRGGTPVKDAYIDYLKTSDSISDKEASKRLDSKISFQQSLSQRQAISEYERVINTISKLS